MAVITSPTPGTHHANGITAGDTQTLAIGTSAANGSAISYNARWQWNLTGAESSANAGSNLQLQSIADDGFTIVATPIAINRATGVVTINTGSSIEFGDGTVSAPSIAPASNAASGIYFTTNAVNVSANGVRAAIFNTATTGVNYLSVTPSAATFPVLLAPAGADTNISLGLAGKGTGTVNFSTIATATGATPQTANGQNGIVTTGTLTTAAATAATYVINNSSVTASSLILVTNQGYSGTLVTNGYPVIFSAVAGSGTITINFANTHAANALNGTLKFGFTVFN